MPDRNGQLLLERCLTLLLLLAGCGHTPRPEQPTDFSAYLEARRAQYLALTPSVQDGDGYVDTDHCDSVLHTALLGAGEVGIENMAAARSLTGQWFRRPLTYDECLASGQSRSSFSRDMVTGLLWYWYTARDWRAAEQFYAYAGEHNLKIGDSDGTIEGLSRVFMSPDLMALLAEVIYRTGGPNHLATRNLATRHSPDVVGFLAHTEVLQAILWRQLTGRYSKSESAAIANHVARRPENALFQYAAGNRDEAARLLLTQHPEGRLPTSADFCNPLRYESEETGPCDEGRTHAPIEFMAISYWLIYEK